MLIAAKSMIEVNKLKSLLSKEFDMKDLGVAKKILGMEFTGIELQGDYGYLSITMLSTNQCPKTDDEVKDMSKVPYASVVGCLMYAMVCTRPELVHAVSVSLVALSTTELEYMAIAEAGKESLWLTGLVKELGIQQGGVQLYCDSQSAIYLAKNQVYHARTKHIDVRFHKIKELVSSGELLLEKVHTSENAADMLTKPVTIEKFKHCLNLINVSKC
uniref:Retrovirus-related Pol polyprotein from transposon TNT 1-94 n=1 Tax=Vitis vinifera TaxID=29760 RepID=A5BT02_VITVI|nr:hypothetical protein VITISV_020397 [Vitis vinifera]